MKNNNYTGLTMRFLETELSQEWIEEYYNKYSFKLIFKGGKKTRLLNIKDYKQESSYMVFGDIIKSPLLVLDRNITNRGVKVNSLHLDNLEGIEVYKK